VLLLKYDIKWNARKTHLNLTMGPVFEGAPLGKHILLANVFQVSVENSLLHKKYSWGNSQQNYILELSIIDPIRGSLI